MKKILLFILPLFILTGCLSTNTFDDDYTYTTIYPIEYITDNLYSDYSSVQSIYPTDTDVNDYELTEKQIKNYASGNTFVYNGLSKEVSFAVDLINNNSKLNIIDGMKGMDYTYSIEELWLDPSNYLMIALNIKNSLLDYESNVYHKDKIEELYDKLKIAISEIDVELTLMGKNANYNNILIADDSLQFLSKYNINILTIDPKNENKNINDAKKMITNGEIKYIYVIKGKLLDEEIKTFINTTGIEKVEIDSFINLTDEQKKSNKDYISIMTENIELLKKELYK